MERGVSIYIYILCLHTHSLSPLSPEVIAFSEQTSGLFGISPEDAARSSERGKAIQALPWQRGRNSVGMDIFLVSIGLTLGFGTWRYACSDGFFLESKGLMM